MKRETHTLRQLFMCLLMVALWLGASAPAKAAEALVPAAQSAPLSAELTRWVGKTPDFQVGSTDLWDTKSMKQILTSMLNANQLKQFRDVLEIGPAFPVQRRGDYLSFEVCEAHACASNFAYFFVNLKTNLVQICWSSVDNSVSVKKDLWLVYGKPARQLPKEGCSKSYDFGLLTLYGEK